MTPGKPSPSVVVDVDAATSAKIRLEGGCRYELRTDLEIVDDETGAVTWPMVLLLPAGNTSALAAVPFHKCLPLVVDSDEGGQELDLRTTAGAGLVWIRMVTA